MPEWFLLIGIGIATLAAVCQPGPSSAVLCPHQRRPSKQPKVQLVYPTMQGQIYVPSDGGCSGWVAWGSRFTSRSSNMEMAYGLAITLTTMLMTIS